MCGIVGCVGRDGDAKEVLLSGLSQLEYRGYDSAGIAVTGVGGPLDVAKREGELQALKDAVEDRSFPGGTGIGHTRWSTHGPPATRNAHPHTDETGRVAVVHNGIIENYAALRDELTEAGVPLTSDTDTEVVPHLFARYLTEGDDPEAAFRRTVSRLEGSYAIAAVVAGEDAVFAARRHSPLVLGVGADENYLASDVTALVEHTREVVYIEDDQFAVLRPSGWRVTDATGERVDPEVRTVDWTAEQTGKSGYDHYMLKEINEQPLSLRQCTRGRVDELAGTVGDEGLDGLDRPDRVQFVACGTSYHAALYGASLLRAAGVQADAYLASEYAMTPCPVTSETLVVGVTQSGETADTLSALRIADDRGARTLAMTNVVGSSAARECDRTFLLRAGPEIGVAATKTFSTQLVGLAVLAEHLADAEGADPDLVTALRDLPDLAQQVLDESRAAEVAEEFDGMDAYFFIGRGLHYPVALEGALKFKEITYEHAEGFAAGELKHGPLALVTGRTPVFAVVAGDGALARKTLANVKEVEARDAPVVVVSDGSQEVAGYADRVLEIPESHPATVPILANLQFQLLAYHVADRLGRPIDKPRNLAKSVTVE
ncbi:glutamine--fructose-6-phosphate transaminase (isomerizing) [Halobium salinum]|uniref:Glutamine--fructose-6-phosphate aminotransferase [isomerizing] n=1 Tax=Halobium salinum TaxID=1364940 RepID=A0ABD5PAL1_9EURY|nr:glutamine--fructose-6-phosphate transaminase (isomerizing) [Halobium salinum]